MLTCRISVEKKGFFSFVCGAENVRMFEKVELWWMVRAVWCGVVECFLSKLPRITIVDIY